MADSQGLSTLFGRVLRKPEPEAPAPPEPAVPTDPREPANDAAAYGVTIKPATVEAGDWFWQAVRVHHLLAEENNNQHHIFVDIRDPLLGDSGSPDGGRAYGTRARISWDGGEQIVTVDKPSNEPGANLPMWRWQVCSIESLGLPGEALPSDKVIGLHTAHPEEGPGNGLFHHSFSVTFVRVRMPSVIYTDSVILGALRGGAGRTLLLQKDDVTVASQRIETDETFRFAGLGAGEYVLRVKDTQFRSEPVRVAGRDQVQLELMLILAESAISGRVRNGAGRSLSLLRDGVEVATQAVAADETYRFTELPPGEYTVVIADAGVASSSLHLDGQNTVTVDLMAPVAGKLLAHYVLFGPVGQPIAQVNLLLAQDYLLAFQPSFGFSPVEAGAAGMVTIIGDESAVSAEVETHLREGGMPVQRIAGTVEEISAALAARIAQRQAFA